MRRNTALLLTGAMVAATNMAGCFNELDIPVNFTNESGRNMTVEWSVATPSGEIVREGNGTIPRTAMHWQVDHLTLKRGPYLVSIAGEGMARNETVYFNTSAVELGFLLLPTALVIAPTNVD